MKIAIITSGFLPVVDGVTVSGFYRLQKLSQWGHEVRLFCPDYSALSKIYPNWQDFTGKIFPGVRVINLASTSFMGLDFERNVAWHSYQTVVKELAEFQPDIIHVDEPERLFCGFLRVPGVDYAKRAGIPCVGFFRTNFLDYAEDYFALPKKAIALIQFLFKKLLLDPVYNSYDLTLATSNLTNKRIARLGINNTRQNYGKLVGIDIKKFHPGFREEGFFSREYGLAEIDGKIKLVFLGRLTPDKGWKFAIEACGRVLELVNKENIAIIIAGDGPMYDEIGRELGKLTTSVHLLGRVSPDRVPALLANSDIHVTTSEKETRGLTVLEAFAAGIPALAPRAGGVTESIEHEWNGLLYNVGDREDFSLKLKHLIENPHLRREMGRRGRECIVEQYSWDSAVQNLVNIWEEQIETLSPIRSVHRRRHQPSAISHRQ